MRPGRYELKPGMRLRDVLTSYAVLFPEPTWSMERLCATSG